MKLKIEETVGDNKVVYDMESDYEEILALVTELGFCKEHTVNTVVNNVAISPDLSEQINQVFLGAHRPGGLLAR